jgi:hypothetical protein
LLEIDFSGQIRASCNKNATVGVLIFSQEIDFSGQIRASVHPIKAISSNSQANPDG